ncbi:hypothetical protein ACE6H2_004009 [Prunus campanulata]
MKLNLEIFMSVLILLIKWVGRSVYLNVNMFVPNDMHDTKIHGERLVLDPTFFRRQLSVSNFDLVLFKC